MNKNIWEYEADEQDKMDILNRNKTLPEGFELVNGVRIVDNLN